MQKLFSLNPGTHLLSTKTQGISNLDSRKKAVYVSSTWDAHTQDVILKAVNITGRPLSGTINLQDAVQVGSKARITLLQSDAITDENSLQEPRKIYPVERSASINGSQFTYRFDP